MKNLFLVLLPFFAGLLYSCSNNEACINSYKVSPTDTVRLDSMYRVRPAVFNGHNYYLYEIGARGADRYQFSVEHSTTCHKCVEAYD